MIDLRLWRAALLAVPLALVVAMFSLQELPRPLESPLSPDAFDGEAAVTLAKDLAEQHPEPRPGSDADAALADLVESRFKSVPGAEVSEQRFEASFDGEDVELRNLILILPGQSERQLALIAGRDTARGSGAATSIASTATLLEIASAISGGAHEKTLVFVSTDGSSIGALGAKRFIEDYTEAGLLDAAIVLSQPSAAEPSQPLVVPWSNGTQSTASRLAQTANTIVSEEVDRPAGDEGPLSDLFRLALPASFGEQGPLIESGLDSVRLSSSGELPVEPGSAADVVNPDTLNRFGRASLSLLLALDSVPGAGEQGPEAYIGLAGNLLPGWTLGMLALALLLPVIAVASVGLARAAHSPVEAARAIGWASLRAIPFLLPLFVLLAFAAVGLVPGPEFPFDPATESLGRGGTIGVVAALLVAGAAAFVLRPLLPPAEGTAACAPAASLALAALAGLAVWAINPYLGVIVALGLQALVPAAAGVAPRRLGAAGIAALGLLPALAMLVDLAGRFGAGAGVLWDLLFLLTGGQLSLRLALLACVLAGATLAVVAANGRRPAGEPQELKLAALVARGRELEQRRAEGRQRRERRKSRRARGERERRRPRAAAEDEGPGDAEPGGPGQAEPGGPGQPEPDPRMWSKPSGISRGLPAASLIATPPPSAT